MFCFLLKDETAYIVAFTYHFISLHKESIHLLLTFPAV